LRLVQFLARRGTNGLGFAQQFAGLQLRAWPVLAAQETRHGRGAKGTGCREGGTRHFRAVSQTTCVDGGLGIVLGQNELLGYAKNQKTGCWSTRITRSTNNHRLSLISRFRASVQIRFGLGQNPKITPTSRGRRPKFGRMRVLVAFWWRSAHCTECLALQMRPTPKDAKAHTTKKKAASDI
jgi:hypothetical protein